MKRIILILLGCIFMGLGFLGILLPVVPQVPFFLVSIFCFMYSSPKIFCSITKTEFYQKYLANIVENRQMSKRNKIIYCITCTISFGVAIYLLRSHLCVSIVLGILWGIYICFILLGLKTK